MKIEYLPQTLKALEHAPEEIRQAFFRKATLLQQNLRHPSLHAKKYDESQDIWQARATKGWRFYFMIENDAYKILKLIRHPK